MENTQLVLGSLDWRESWLIRDFSASSFVARCVRTPKFLQWAGQAGVRTHTLRLVDATGKPVDALPPEFIGRLVAPFCARALNHLVPLSNWCILVESLMSALPYERALARMRSVKVLAQDPLPSRRGLYTVARRSLARVMPYLWGDGTEIYLMPAISEDIEQLPSIFHRQIGVSEVRDFVQRLPVWAAIFRDATVIEIVSPYPTDKLYAQMRLGTVNRAWQRKMEEITAWWANLRQTHPGLEQMVFEWVETFWRRSRSYGSRDALRALASARCELVGGYPVGRSTFDLLLRYEYLIGIQKSIHWLLARCRSRGLGLFMLRLRSLGCWICPVERTVANAREL